MSNVFADFPLSSRHHAPSCCPPARRNRLTPPLTRLFACSSARREKVQEAAAGLPDGRFTGCFVGTAMNHRAAKHSGFAGVPITAAAAVAALRASLPQFRSLQGEVYERMMGDAKPGSSYPLARITAMHTFRLATVLEAMFAPESQFFFARNGLDAAGSEIDCEWTVGAFAQLARSSQ